VLNICNVTTSAAASSDGSVVDELGVVEEEVGVLEDGGADDGL